MRNYDVLKAEVTLNAHTRFDFQAKNSRTGEIGWVEVKCVTLVDDQKIGWFPDAPSERASKHLRELILLVRPAAKLAHVIRTRQPGVRSFVYFILQNPRGLAVSPKADTDPIFAATLRKAAKSKVILRAFRARVNLKGAVLEKPIPVLL
ncbi:MAG TPA: DNA/RNA nuclease SfsA [bacterium]